MAETVSLWCVRIAVPAAAGAFAEALEPFCQSVSWSADSDGGEAAVEGICQERPRRAVLARALDGVAAALGTKAPALRFGRLQSRDWLAESVHAFPPIEAGRYYIHGSHEMAPLGAKPRLGLGEDRPAPSLAIVMDAGAAFGTGEHPSTRGCLVALDALARRRRFRVPLDMGCGAGLLAIAMAKTWRRPVVACDIDPVAVRVARANAERNGVGGRVRAGQGDGYGAPCVRRGAPYDLVVQQRWRTLTFLPAVVGDLQSTLFDHHPAALTRMIVNWAHLANSPAQENHLVAIVCIHEVSRISLLVPYHRASKLGGLDPTFA